jgi:translation initiation factor 2B subunit (eIF-2B alpha/beta/delta family)
MSQDTFKVVENRQNMKMEGNSKGAKKLNEEIQKRIRKDKENYLRENAESWKSTIKKEEPRNYTNR